MNTLRIKNRYLFLQGLALCCVCLTLSNPAHAGGGVDGGGGGAVRCEAKKSNGLQIASIGGSIKLGVGSGFQEKPLTTNGRDVQFLDLWEASTGYGPFFLHPQKIAYSNDKVDVQIESALNRLSGVLPEFGKTVRLEVAHIRTRWMKIPDDAHVDPPTDTKIRFMRDGCEVIGLGAYSDSQDNLAVDILVAKQMTPTDFAALFVHEAVYKVLRDQAGASDSWKTRRIVGLMFAEGPINVTELQNGFPPPPTEKLD